MASISIVDEFMKRLQQAERACDPKELVELFEDGAELCNLTRHNTTSKTNQTHGPMTFWKQYLTAFQKVSSEFTNVIDDGTHATLEWHSSGVLPMGVPIEYNGVTLIEYQSGGKIKKLRTYYDSAAFLPHAPRAEKTLSESVGAPEITNQATS